MDLHFTLAKNGREADGNIGNKLVVSGVNFSVHGHNGNGLQMVASCAAINCEQRCSVLGKCVYKLDDACIWQIGRDHKAKFHHIG